MLAQVVEASVRHRAVVLFGAAALVLWGLAALRDLPLDAFPDTTPVQVTVNTLAPALAPLEVEQQLTFPVEQALSGLPGLVGVRSLSRSGFSQVTCQFQDGVELAHARQSVMERVAAVELPLGLARPTLGPVATGLGEVFHYVVSGQGQSLTELRTIHDWIVRPQLRSVAGVAEVNAWGGKKKQYQVIVDPDLLLKHELTLDAVARALRRNNQSVGGGLVSAGGEALLVRGLALATSKREIEEVVVAARAGAPILVSHVAQVLDDAHEQRRGATTADGKGEVVLGLGFALMGENTREVTQRLERRLAEVARSLPPGVSVEPVYTRLALVDRVLATVRRNLLEGALLVVAVLFAFLGNLRAGLIVALAIPLSLLFAFDQMLRFGIAGTLMSLGAIDFGLVVDSSVIVVENATRRLAEDRSGRSVAEVVRDATLEVRRPTLFGELIIAIVYLPILTLEGVEGKLFRPMALTVIFALLGSMLLSLTVIPALASLALRRPRSAREPLLLRLLLGLYRPVVAAALARPRAVLAAALLAVLGAAALAPRLGREFVPRLAEEAVAINTIRLASVSLEESVRVGTAIEQRLLREFPDEVQRVWTRTGTAEVATDPMGLEVSDVFLALTPRERWTRARTQDELTALMRRSLEDLPGMRLVFSQPIEMRLNEMVAGVRADVGVKLFGDDLDVLRLKAAEVQAAIAKLEGTADVSVEQVTGLPALEVVVRRDALARHGLAAEEVLEVVEALGGKKVSEVREGERRFDLVLRIDHRYAHDPREVERLLVAGPEGQQVPLGRLAHVSVVEGPAAIQREWARRRVVVQANARGRDLGGYVAEVRRAVDSVSLPPGYHVSYGGQFEHLERAQDRLLLVVPLALLLVLALLHLTYGRLRDALRVFTGVPFAAVGGVLALWLRDLPFSVSAGVGFVALAGVSVLGDMVLVSHLRRLLAEGRPLLEAVREAAEARLRPVVMTGLVAALGFLPMALNTGVGAEVQRPLATVVVGGVVTSTLATLLVLPVLYTVLGAGARRREEEEAPGAEEGGPGGEPPPPSTAAGEGAASGEAEPA